MTCNVRKWGLAQFHADRSISMFPRLLSSIDRGPHLCFTCQLSHRVYTSQTETGRTRNENIFPSPLGIRVSHIISRMLEARFQTWDSLDSLGPRFQCACLPNIVLVAIYCYIYSERRPRVWCYRPTIAVQAIGLLPLRDWVAIWNVSGFSNRTVGLNWPECTCAHRMDQSNQMVCF